MYKPLPESVTIKQSGINGLGVFADQDIKQATNLGMTHLKIGDTIFRTPLGGFINHSDDPNCTKTVFRVSNFHDAALKMDYKAWKLFAINDIKEGEELTLEYTFYKIYEERKRN